ncbi:MAG: hypothetical protein D3X82_13635 [Candidatus Leucobacter sulfamidivorax]|nr:hypothetical protein [Candidatus Leucobacter sulfamidivorax]
MRKRKREKRHLWHRTPYDGVPGLYAALQRFLYQFQGPSQLGDRGEPPYVPPPDPKCPMCKQPMQDHRFDRGGPGKPTYMKCPKPGNAPATSGRSAESTYRG